MRSCSYGVRDGNVTGLQARCLGSSWSLAELPRRYDVMFTPFQMQTGDAKPCETPFTWATQILVKTRSQTRLQPADSKVKLLFRDAEMRHNGAEA